MTGQYWGVVVSGAGVLFGVIEYAHIRAMSTPVGIVLEGVLPFVGALGLVAAGYVLWTERYIYGDVHVPRVVGWTALGMVGMALVFLWTLSHQLIRGGPFHHAHFILVNNVIVGGVIGFVVGTYDARSRAFRRSIHQEQLKHGFLNRVLRHHVLNGMNVILGEVDNLERHSDAPPDSIATIRQRGKEIAARIDSVKTITHAFTEQTPPALGRQDLSTILEDTADRVERRYETAVVSLDVPDGVTVRADRFLPTVLENLLSNAIEHNDEASPRVQVSLTTTEETAVVRIADTGPGIPAERKDALFEWEDQRDRNIDDVGIGLAIVSVLVDRYDGHVRLEDNDPTGTVAYVELPRAR